MNSCWKDLPIPVPETIVNFSTEKQKEIYEYLKQLNEKDMIAYKIALDHLGTSFNIVRSNGFTEWINKNNK